MMIVMKLVVAVGTHLRGNRRMLRIGTPPGVVLLQTPWVLANPLTAVQAANLVCPKEWSFFIVSMIETLREMALRYILWPSQAGRDITKAKVEVRFGYLGVVGCIDGTPINMTAPLKQPQQYVDRHHNYAILNQAVSDHNMLYRDVYIGQPGSVGDNRMYARSPLCDNLLRRPDMMNPDEHLLADGAYIFTDKILISYVDNRHLTDRQKKHNYYSLSSARASVKRSFGQLMGKFRHLKFFPNYSLYYAMDHIMSPFVVHNFTILDREEPEGLHWNGVLIENRLEGPEEDLKAEAQHAGAIKRHFISQLLYPHEDWQ